MAHLSPKKGGFPFKDQHDRTCPVKYEDIAKVERGIVLCVNDDGEFQIADTADAGKKPLYLSLQGEDDLQADMAGFFSVAKGDADAHLRGPKGEKIKISSAKAPYKDHRATPAVTGILLGDDTWQLDTFDETAADADYAINGMLTVKDGRFKPTSTASEAVAYVVKGPYTRYANDAVAVKDLMTGSWIRVTDIQGK